MSAELPSTEQIFTETSRLVRLSSELAIVSVSVTSKIQHAVVSLRAFTRSPLAAVGVAQDSRRGRGVGLLHGSFCLLYKQQYYGDFSNFPKISENFRKLSQNCLKFIRKFPIIFRKFPMSCEDFRRLTKAVEYFRVIYEDVSII